MRKLIAITHLSLDGVMQAPGGPDEDPSGGFAHGGWIMPLGDAVLRDALAEIMAGDFDLLLGQFTYDLFAAYWPRADAGFIADAFNQAAKYVATRRDDGVGLTWATTHRLAGDAADAVRRLKRRPTGRTCTSGAAATCCKR